jgi:hypothetical protein
MIGGTLNFLGNAGMFSGMLTGDPESWINAFGYGDPNVGDIKKDWGGTGLYMQIMSIEVQYTPILDGKGNAIIDQSTGKPSQRILRKTVTANVYSDYIWNEDNKKFEGINKVDSKTEVWEYNDKGKRVSEKPISEDII